MPFADALEPDLNGQILFHAETHLFHIVPFIIIARFVRLWKRISLLANLSISLAMRITVEDVMLQHEYQVKADREHSKSEFRRIAKN